RGPTKLALQVLAEVILYRIVVQQCVVHVEQEDRVLARHCPTPDYAKSACEPLGASCVESSYRRCAPTGASLWSPNRAAINPGRPGSPEIDWSAYEQPKSSPGRTGSKFRARGGPGRMHR